MEMEEQIEIQRQCSNCGRVEKQCRCSARNIVDVEVVRQVRKESESEKEVKDQGLSKEDLKRIEARRDEKSKKSAEKKARNGDLQRRMNLDDDELEEEKLKEEKDKKELSKAISAQASDNADRIKDKEAELKGQGLPRHELKAEMREFKKSLKEGESEKQAEEPKKRGRKKKS